MSRQLAASNSHSPKSHARQPRGDAWPARVHSLRRPLPPARRGASCALASVVARAPSSRALLPPHRAPSPRRASLQPDSHADPHCAGRLLRPTARRDLGNPLAVGCRNKALARTSRAPNLPGPLPPSMCAQNRLAGAEEQARHRGAPVTRQTCLDASSFEACTKHAVRSCRNKAQRRASHAPSLVLFNS